MTDIADLVKSLVGGRERIEILPEVLAAVSGQLNSQVYRFPWAKDDAIITAGVDPCPGSMGTPAWYIDATGDVSLDLVAAYDGDEAKIRQVVREIAAGGHTKIPPMLLGFVAHEYAHSRWSSWTAEKDTPPLVREVMELFEELRIESRAVNWKGAQGAYYLRHSFQWILRQMAKGEISTRPLALGHTWALTYGRYLASIASEAEVEPIDLACRTSLSDDTVDFMREILEEAITTSSIRRVQELAEEWIDLLKTDEDEMSSPMMITLIMHGSCGSHGDNDEGDGEEGNEEGEGGKGGEGDEKDDADGKGGSGAPEPDPDPEMKEIIEKAIALIAKDIAPESPIDYGQDSECRDPMDTAAKVFGHGRSRSGGQNWRERTPTGEQRHDAIKFARTLETLALPSVTLRRVASTLPPGRLRGREAVRQSAERDMGLLSTATPWKSSKRQRSHTKPVIVGTMTDTSGSMAWAENLVADFAWTMSTAGIRVGARSAAVTFGHRAEMITRPGETPDKIRVRKSNSGQEAFDEAAAAIEGVLHLSVPVTAAKVLFVISDGQLVIEGEKQRAATWLERWTKAGTLVVWIGAHDSCWKVISKKVRTPGRAINIPVERGYGTFDTSALFRRMEAEVVKAAKGMAL